MHRSGLLTIVGLLLWGCRTSGPVRESIDSPVAASERTMVQPLPGTELEFELAYVAGGVFEMGSPDAEPGRGEDEGPQRLVSVEPFWMGVREVTWDEFAVFRNPALDNHLAADGDTTFDVDAVARPSKPYEDPSHGMGTSGFPAVGMTQWAALHYARWLSEKTGRFFRLPTEAEWEFACRAGTSTAFSFGEAADSLDAYGWYWDNSGESFREGGTRRPNALGLYDMHGNVSEWTLDEYSADFYSTMEGDTVRSPWSMPTRLHPRTVRGGAYDDDPEDLRCAARLQSSLNWKKRDPQIPKSFWWNTDSPFVGFRLVSPAEDPDPEEIEAFWQLVLGG